MKERKRRSGAARGMAHQPTIDVSGGYLGHRRETVLLQANLGALAPITDPAALSRVEQDILAAIKQRNLLPAALPDLPEDSDGSFEEAWRDQIFGVKESPAVQRLLERLHDTALLELLERSK